jgi:CheY-like chemotaxis protein
MSNDAKTVVLIADDEPSTLALLGRHLRSRGYGVLEAADGDEAWELAHEHLPDLVILDVMMPGMSGWEVCRKVREAVSLAHTGVIMLTGIGETLNEMTSPLYGADAHVDKPFEFATLDARIGEVLERRRAGAFGRPDHADEENVRIALPSETEKPLARAKPAPPKARPAPTPKKAAPVKAEAQPKVAAKQPSPPARKPPLPAKKPSLPAKKPVKQAPPKTKKAATKTKPVAKKAPTKATKTTKPAKKTTKTTKATKPAKKASAPKAVPPKAKAAKKAKPVVKKPAKTKASPPKTKPAKKRR